MDSMARDLASPRRGDGETLGAGPRPRGQKFSGGGRLGNGSHAVKPPARGGPPWAAARAGAALAAAAAALAAAGLGAAPERVRVGTSGDYAPFSLGRGAAARGFDLEVARAFA